MQQELRRLNTQKGMSSIAWVAIIVLIGLFGITVIQLAPLYWEYYTIGQILDDIKAQPGLSEKGKPGIANALDRRLSIESTISNLNRNTYVIEKVKGKNSFMIKVDYEVRKSWVANVFLVVTFQRSVEVGGG